MTVMAMLVFWDMFQLLSNIGKKEAVTDINNYHYFYSAVYMKIYKGALKWLCSCDSI